MTIKLTLVPALEAERCVGCAHYVFAPNYIPGTDCNEQAVGEFSKDKCFGGEHGQIWVQAVRPRVPTARANDPVTSKGKRKVNKYEQAVLSCLASGPKTGKEMVAICGFPLNCITPRFAPLRRKGLIAPLYSEGYGHPIVKRDKQIVWVLA